MKSNTKSLFVPRAGLSMLALLPLFGLGAAQAQPNVENAPKAQNPTNRPARPPRLDRDALARMTPEERMKQIMRLQLQRIGVTDDASQATLMSYIEGEVKAHVALAEQSRQLQTAMHGAAIPDTQIAGLLNNYQAAVEEDKARRAKAENDLRKVLDLSKMPKVEAMLTLTGFYGDAPSMMMTGLMMMGGERRGGRDGAEGARGETRRNRAGGDAPAANGAAPAAPTRPVRPRRNREPAAPAATAAQG
ncbi:MAG: hypothetical protein KY445_07530 [Armatimonadetes bacterium]|nr:hypothetical protein [Armatimonadota bacterium]